jgi:hypothetical protein
VFLLLLLKVSDFFGREVRAAADVGAVDVADNLRTKSVAKEIRGKVFKLSFPCSIKVNSLADS